MRGALFAAFLAGVIAALAGAQVATAQDDGGRPVVGGGSFNTAPVLEPGSYEDTLLLGETLFYAVRLTEGQTLRVTATLDAGLEDVDDAPNYATALFIGELFTPLRDSVSSTRDLGTSEDDSDAQVVVTELDAAVGPLPAADEAETDYTGPGLYYVIVNLTESVVDLGAPIELPLALEVEVGGRPGGDPGAGIGFAGAGEPGAAQPGERAADERDSREDTGETDREGADDDGANVVLLVAGGVGGLAAGGLLGIGGIVLLRHRAG